MNLSDITTKPWILALFKRDDGERFLLGDGYYDFKDSLQHFQPNSMSNDIVELQGTDGQLLAGQVRRSGTQSFDGYIGDGTTNKQIVEQRRKAFLMFFRKKHYYTVVYIFCDGTAIKRERGYLVDAPSVPEIRQKSPEYHVALNFENVNYYEYAENAQGDEIYSNVREIVVSNLISGGLVWDELGAVSDAIQWGAYTTESGSFITLNDAIQNAPMSLSQIKGNAEQNGTPTPDAPVPVDVVTGEQNIVVEKDGKNLWNGEFRQGSRISGNITTRIYSTQVLKLESGVTYTISSSLDYSAFVFAVNLCSVPYGTVSPALSYDSGWKTNSFTFTPAQDGYFGVVIARSDLTSNLTPSDIDGVNFQLEKSNSASSYEPYVATNQEINLGKNLADLSTFTFGYVAATGVVNTGSHPLGEMVSPFIKVFPNTAYTFKIVETTGTNDSWFGVGEYTAESTSSFVRRGTNITTTATSITFTTSATTNYVLVSARNLEQATKVQLEKGFQATSWAEYFTPIELAKIGTYQDRIYKDGEKWYIEKQVGKVVLDGSETGTWNLSSGTGRYSFWIHSNQIPGAITTEPSPKICDKFVYVNESYQTAPIPSLCENSNTTNILFLFNTDGSQATTVADWKTWLGTHPTTVYYALATATDTEITDDTLLEQLEHIYQLYGGVNNISIVGEGNGSIEISYATELNPGGGLVWEDGGTGGLTTITIDAVDLTLPVWTITGPATNPTLSNITTGQTMSWLGTVPSGQTLIIDMNEQTATMAGANVYAFLSGNWVGLAPGTNRISYSVTGTDESSTLSWNNIVG